MHALVYTPKFIRQWKKLPPALQDEVEECLQLLKANPKQATLRTHKLTGHLRRFYSCSVNYRYRVIFEWDDSRTIALLAVGDHAVYQ